MKDEVSLIGANDVELAPSAVAAPLIPNAKVRLDEEEVDAEEFEVDETIEVDDVDDEE